MLVVNWTGVVGAADPTVELAEARVDVWLVSGKVAEETRSVLESDEMMLEDTTELFATGVKLLVALTELVTNGTVPEDVMTLDPLLVARGVELGSS